MTVYKAATHGPVIPVGSAAKYDTANVGLVRFLSQRFDHADSEVFAADLNGRGIKPLPLIARGNTGEANNGTGVDGITNAEWDLYVQQTVDNVRSGVTHFEVGNEVPQANWDRLFVLYRRAVPIIRAAGKKAILGACVPGLFTAYQNAAEANGLFTANLVDGVAIHPYDQAGPNAVKANVAGLRSQLDGIGKTAMQIWITEVGWGIGSGNYTVANQAAQRDAMTETYELLRNAAQAWKIQTITWFQLQDSGGSGWEASSGLLNTSDAPKLIHAPFAALPKSWAGGSTSSFYFRIGTQETITNLDFTVAGTGGLGNGDGGAIRGAIVRLMVHFPGEIDTQANRTIQAWNSGRFPIPMINTTIAANGTAYRAAVKQFLDIVAPVGGSKKCEVIEVGNEPNGDLAGFLDRLKASYDLIRARGVQVMLGAVVQGGTYTTGGTTYTGNQAVSRAINNNYRGVTWAMVDHIAVHDYSQNEGAVINAVETQRTMFPISKGMWLTESGWPRPWPGSSNPNWNQPISESQRIDKILNFGTALKNRAEALNLRGWSYFAYSDWGSASVPPHFAKMGLVTRDDIPGGGATKVGGNVHRLPSDQPGGDYAPGGRRPTGDDFTSSWQALNALPGKTLIGAIDPPDITPPEVVTNAATLIQQTSARLNATVDANGLSTTWDFELGTTSGVYPTTVTGGTASGGAPVAVFRTPTLVANQTYYYRVVATNADGSDAGAEQSFTTLAAAATAPVVSTNPQQGVTENAAVLLGTVNPSGSSTTYRFVYGTSSPPATQTAIIGTLTGSTDQDVQFPLTDLDSNTIYYFRTSATNSAGTTNGGILSFATQVAAVEVAAAATVPSRLLEAVKTSHTMAVRAEVLRNG